MKIKNKLIKLTIASKGRKYFKVTYPGRTFTYNLAIDEVTKNLEVGKTYNFATKEIIEEGYRTTYSYVAYSVLDKDFTSEDNKVFDSISTNLSYIKENLGQYWYKNGAEKVEQGLKRMEQLGVDCSNFKDRYQSLKQEWLINEEKLAVVKSKERVNNYFDYIRQAIKEGYWYQKGEDTVQLEIEFLNSKGVCVENYETKLNELKKMFEASEKENEVKLNERIKENKTSEDAQYSIPGQRDLFLLKFPDATHFICWECGRKMPIHTMRQDGSCGC